MISGNRAIASRHGGELIFRGDRDQVLGQGRAFEEAESGAGVELDVHRIIGSLGH